MITVRKSEDRGSVELDWLSSRHSFSFGHYYDPNYMGFGPLKVINEDRVVAGGGFDTHGHRDMEIISYVLEGALEHKDSLGTGSVIRPGDVQRMTAGTGIMHSEFNASDTEQVRFLQIWIEPNEAGLQPSYEQKSFCDGNSMGGNGTSGLRLVVSPDARSGALKIHQDVLIHAGTLSTGDREHRTLAQGRKAWLQIAAGSVSLNGEHLGAGDGAAISDETALELQALTDSEVLLFDLPPTY